MGGDSDEAESWVVIGIPISGGCGSFVEEAILQSFHRLEGIESPERATMAATNPKSSRCCFNPRAPFPRLRPTCSINQ